MNFKNITLIYTLLIISSFSLFSQEHDYTWWNNKHNWDGHTHWSDYINVSPGFMGPNALRLPDDNIARTDSFIIAEVGTEFHTGDGDNTFNPYGSISFPLFTKRAMLQIYTMPYEYFKTDTIVRDLRKARHKEAKGWSKGDIYIVTWIQLIENHRNLPDIVLRTALKTASGENLQNARFTDSPAYFFDIAAAKNFKISRLAYVRPFAAYGIYVYQTNLDNNYQNDCWMYSAGLLLSAKHTKTSASISGYNGYLEIKDKPIVLRANFAYLFDNSEIRFLMQKGIRDISHFTFRLSYAYKIRLST